MTEELQEQQDLVEDLLGRLADPGEKVRETAAEALAVSTGDEDWRPDDLILGDGIDTIAGLLGDRNVHTVGAALTILTAIASVGEEEALVERGVIAVLEPMRDHRDPGVREKVRELLWLLSPEVEDVVTSKPQDEY
ncbi:MAG TPA: hypothetical protein VEI51_05360 [Methanomicrobiales archaeon]|nr:hypothetical protein [Methanomicrobiales archaeon]